MDRMEPLIIGLPMVLNSNDATPHCGQLPSILNRQFGLPLSDPEDFIGTQNPKIGSVASLERVPDILL